MSVITEMTTSQLYFLASGSICSLESVFPDAELSRGLLRHAFSPASIATGFMVSMDKGRSVTSWTTPTSHCMFCSGSLFIGPTFRSMKSAPALV